MKPKQPQQILVCQQNGSGEDKIAGIVAHGDGRIHLRRFAVDDPLPPLLEDTRGLLPESIDADLVLDFFRHPDLSWDLARLCRSAGIPLIASGKKIPGPGVHTPPT